MMKTDRGASLISALLLVALMSTIAMSLATDLRFSLRRGANLDVRDQAYWYALGAREYIESEIVRAMRSADAALRPDADWLSGPQVFPIERGQLAGEIRDGNNCFNLNSLVIEGDEGWQADPDQIRRFAILLETVGLDALQAMQLAAEASDWIDSDTRPQQSGAEDDTYLRLDNPYRTANTLMAEREEMLALASMTPEAYRRIAALVCTRPSADALPLNINTLRFDQLPLLVAAFDGALSLTSAEAVLIQRPLEGYTDMEDFWALDALAQIGVDALIRERVGRTTRYFEVEIDVVFAGTRFELSETVEYRAGRLNRISQKYGSFS